MDNNVQDFFKSVDGKEIKISKVEYTTLNKIKTKEENNKYQIIKALKNQYY